MTNRTDPSNHPQPPGPKRRLPFSNLLAYRRSPLEFFQNLAKHYGDISLFRIGPQQAFLVNHPDLIKEILVTNHANFEKGLVLQRAKRLLGEDCSPAKASFIDVNGDCHSLHFIVSESPHTQTRWSIMQYAPALVGMKDKQLIPLTR